MNDDQRIALLKFAAAVYRHRAAACDCEAQMIKAMRSINKVFAAHRDATTREANELLASHPDLAELNAMANGFYEIP